MTTSPGADREPDEPPDPASENAYDVVVIGGGAAGLSGATVLATARHRVLVVDAGKPRNERAEHVHGFLSRDGIDPGELLRLGREELRSYGGTIQKGTIATIEPFGRDEDDELMRFRLRLEDGSVVHARRVLVATGLADQPPDIPGLAELWGIGVYTCPFCHGWDVQDQRLAVLATAQDSVHLAMLLRQWSDRVTLFVHTEPAPDAEDAARLAARDITVTEGRVVRVCQDRGRITSVELADGSLVACDALFLAPAATAADHLLESVGCEVTDEGRVSCDEMGQTSHPGVWAAGNVVDPAAMVVVAAGAGVGAAVAITADLAEDDAERAVRRSRSSA